MTTPLLGWNLSQRLGRNCVGFGRPGLVYTPQRFLHLHEYQAAQLVHEYKIAIPRGNVAFNKKEAYNIARKLYKEKVTKFVVKAQVQHSARRKGHFRENGFKSGIHIVDTLEEVAEVAGNMCGKHFVQPGGHSKGNLVKGVLVMEYIEAVKRYYISIAYDRVNQCPSIYYSDKGGLSAMKIIKNYPESIRSIPIDVKAGLQLDELYQIAENLDIHHKQNSLAFKIKNLYECFMVRDLLQLTVNPLMFTAEEKFVAGNVNILMDPVATYR